MPKNNPFAILGRGGDDEDQQGGESSCGSSGEGTCGGHSTPPSTPSTPQNPVAGREDAPQFPGTLGVAPATQALDIGALASLMAKKMGAQQGANALMVNGEQPLPAQADRSRENYLQGMSRGWR